MGEVREKGGQGRRQQQSLKAEDGDESEGESDEPDERAFLVRSPGQKIHAIVCECVSAGRKGGGNLV